MHEIRTRERSGEIFKEIADQSGETRDLSRSTSRRKKSLLSPKSEGERRKSQTRYEHGETVFGVSLSAVRISDAPTFCLSVRSAVRVSASPAAQPQREKAFGFPREVLSLRLQFTALARLHFFPLQWKTAVFDSRGDTQQRRRTSISSFASFASNAAFETEETKDRRVKTTVERRLSW